MTPKAFIPRPPDQMLASRNWRALSPVVIANLAQQGVAISMLNR